MARPVYSFDFFTGAITTSDIVAYGVPEGNTAVLRDVTGVIGSSGVFRREVVIQIAGITIMTFVAPPGPEFPFHRELRSVAPGLTEIGAFMVSSDTVVQANLSLSGYLLTA